MNELRVEIGLERCLEQPPEILRAARFGLLMNQASVDHSFRYACDLLAARFPGQLKAIFSPQHGLWGEEQANMVESPNSRYEPLDLPVVERLARDEVDPDALADLREAAKRCAAAVCGHAWKVARWSRAVLSQTSANPRPPWSGLTLARNSPCVIR